MNNNEPSTAKTNDTQHNKDTETSPVRLPKQNLVGLQNLAHRFNKYTLSRPIARAIELLIRFVFNASIPAAARIHRSVHLGHNALGVVLNRNCVIEANCIIGTHVVLGGKTPIKGAPHLEESVIVHSGAVIIGPVKIGTGAVVGANAVVTIDVPPNSVVVGVPAKVIKKNIDPAQYFPKKE